MRYVRLLPVAIATLLLLLAHANSPVASAAIIIQPATLARVEASSFDGLGTVSPPVVKQKTNFTTFNEGANSFDDLNEGRSAQGQGLQNTTIDSTNPQAITIDTLGSAMAGWTDGQIGDGKDPSGHGKSQLIVFVQVTDTPVPYTVSGSLSASVTGGTIGCVAASIELPGGTTLVAAAPAACGQSTRDVDHSGELAVGNHAFVISANAPASNSNSTGGTADVQFDISITLGDPNPVLDSVEFTQAIQELQTISELKADLAGDGKPPVPIVANKPLAMRVYFSEVADGVSYVAEVSGQVTDEVAVTLQPGCTPSDRRKNINNCESVDFYFNPPEGSWSVRLVVKDDADETVADHTFNLTSVKTDDVTLKAVSVCDSQTGPGNSWECADAFELISQASLVRRMFPTANLKVIVSGDVVRRDASTFSDSDRWWSQVARDLDGLHTNTDELFGLQGTEIYYYGIARQEVPPGLNGAAYIDTRGAASRDNIPLYEVEAALVAHELGHAMGLDHTGTDEPVRIGNAGCHMSERTTLPDYPYADNRIRSGSAPGELEVGFDVASGTPLNGEFFYEIMAYCESPAPPIAPDVTSWITPFSYNELIAPAGPLSVDPVPPQPAAIPAAVSDFWLLQGHIPDGSPNATLDPLITVSGEGPTGPGSGTHRIEVHGPGGLLFTRMFTPAHGHGSPSPGDPVVSTGSAFSELIPVQAGATSIQVFDALQTQIGAITLGGAAPVVDSITLPAAFTGPQSVSWSVTDPDSADHAYRVDYSPDGGQTWQSQGIGLTETTLVLNFDQLAGSNAQGLFRVTASDGANSGSDTSAVFSVSGKLPQGEIIGPQRTSFRKGELVWLEAAAWDIDDGTLDDGAVTWSSSNDGALGTGASLHVYELSVGSHTITMTARDSDNNTVTDTISITVTDSTIAEGNGDTDIDCSGQFNAADALALLLHLNGLDSGSCREIGIGAPIAFGNVDCDDTVSLTDVAELLALVANVRPSCVS